MIIINGIHLLGEEGFRCLRRQFTKEMLWEFKGGSVTLDHGDIIIVGSEEIPPQELLNRFAFDNAMGKYWEELELLDRGMSPLRAKFRVYLADISPNTFFKDRRDAHGYFDPFAPESDSEKLAHFEESFWENVSDSRETRFTHLLPLLDNESLTVMISPTRGLCMAHEVFSLRILDSGGLVIGHFPELLRGDVWFSEEIVSKSRFNEFRVRYNDHGKQRVFSIRIELQQYMFNNPD